MKVPPPLEIGISRAVCKIYTQAVLVHKTQNSQTYFFHKFIFFKDFFKKKRNPLFWVRLALFLLGAYVKSLLLFLKCFLTRQFYEFSFLRCSFSSWHAHFFKNSPRFLYFSIRYVHSKKNQSCVTQDNTVYAAQAKFILTRNGHSQTNTVVSCDCR